MLGGLAPCLTNQSERLCRDREDAVEAHTSAYLSSPCRWGQKYSRLYPTCVDRKSHKDVITQDVHPNTLPPRFTLGFD